MNNLPENSFHAAPILPEDREDIKFKEPFTIAAGVTAVVGSFRKGIQDMGLQHCLKTLNNLNQTDGYDCPSCAWPDPRPEERSSFAEYCENGAKAIAEEATNKRADPDFWRKHSVAELMTWSELDLGRAGRFTHPMVLREGDTHYEEISWEAANAMIAEKLNSLASPDEAVFYTSGRASNEAAFLYQLFVRQYGTNNLPDCSNMCHECTSLALAETVGIGKGSVKLEDFYIADCIVIIGQNPGTNHPRMMSALQKAKRKGAKIISINPLPEPGLMKFKNPQELQGWTGAATDLSDVFLQLKINTDVALLKALMAELYHMEQETGGIFDHDFIEKYTSGYEDFVKNIATQNTAVLAAEAGVDLEKIKEAARIIAKNKRMIICWAMGITQHENGVDNVKEIINLALLRGSIGIPGAGLCPVRGHSNVQGDRTVGIWEKLKPEFAKKLKDAFHFEPPKEDGYDVVDALKAMHEGRAKFFMSLGGNLLLAASDTNFTAEAIRRCDLTVMVSTKPNRNHLVTGKTALVLPCLGRTEKDVQNGTEQFVSTENSMGIVQKSQGVIPPASAHLRSEPAIVAGIAAATLGSRSSVDWVGMAANYDRIREAIERTIPGFEKYNERVRREGGFYLPNGARERTFRTSDERAHFSVVQLPKHSLQPGEYLMASIRTHDQFNTTIYGNEDRYRGISGGRRVVMMHPDDVAAAGLTKGEWVDLLNETDGTQRWARNFTVLPYDIPRGCIATFYPETNVLIPISKYARQAQTPSSKSVAVKIMRK